MTRWRIFCLILALLLPINGAMAEITFWPDARQLVDVPDGPEITHHSLSMEIDGDALDAFLAPLFESRYSMSSGIPLDTTPEEAEALDKWNRQIVQKTQKLFSTYVNAFAALANKVALEVDSRGDESRVIICLNEQPVMELSRVHGTDGTSLLLSDLFPSYGLVVEKKEADPLEEALLSIAMDAKADLFQADLLPDMVDISRQQLEALHEAGLAEQDGDTLRYTGSDIELITALAELGMAYTPIFARILGLYEAIATAIYGEGEALYEQETPYSLVFEITGDEVFEEISFPVMDLLNFSYDEDSDTFSYDLVPTEEERKITSRYSGNKLSLYETSRLDYVSTSLEVDASAADDILCTFTHWMLGEDNVFTLHFLTADDEKTMSIEMCNQDGSGFALPSIYYTEEPIALLPAMRFDISVTADNSFAVYTVSSRKDSVWLPIMRIMIAAGTIDTADFPTPEGKTIIYPDFWGEYNDAGFKAELRKVAVPYLNRLALTKLPVGARPLILPLLGIISELGD